MMLSLECAYFLFKVELILEEKRLMPLKIKNKSRRDLKNSSAETFKATV